MEEILSIDKKVKELESQNEELNNKIDIYGNEMSLIKCEKYPIIYMISSRNNIYFSTYKEAKAWNTRHFPIFIIKSKDNKDWLRSDISNELNNDPLIKELEIKIMEINAKMLNNEKLIKEYNEIKNQKYTIIKDEFCKLNPFIYAYKNEEKYREYFFSYEDAYNKINGDKRLSDIKLISIHETSSMDLDIILKIHIKTKIF